MRRYTLVRAPTLGLVALCAVACGSVPTPSSETLQWEVGDYVLVSETETGWKGVGGRKTMERIFAMPGATAEDWTVTLHITELPIAVTLETGMQWNARSIMDAGRQSLVEQGCGDPWRVIRSDADSLMYERDEVDCPGYLHEHELGRILVGDWFMGWASYRIRNTSLSGDERSELIARLEQARVVD